MECSSEFATCNACYYAFVRKNANVRRQTFRGGSRYADDISNTMGIDAETAFQEICAQRGMKFRLATKTENCRRHFDIVLLENGTGSKVDIKAMKSPKRGAPPDPNIIYLELRNVDGNDGWLFGQADYIAFQQAPKSFWMVPRSELVKVVETMLQLRCCKNATVSGIPRSLYSRKNRQDLLMILSRDDEFLQMCQGCFVFGE